ncbi:vWA domain-containing protein [Thermosediminibacter oceani]|uniref:von Willebrand factor type A n=1 Tax=Thermosediminibacter oceani (strain ATCC BAA-1034 / DSM 16646 / JW/IW-1228P) TaxID=555079 RepID=D9RXP8_THEOJ|nr:VWA domain-containing protein [Thermosediminibacter oceani]ADL08122.1 von Willebrand factor type A [Thermosediminibacter oceani DSM 16646]
MNSPVEKMKIEFSKGRGVRIGEAAVASRKVHVISPYRPQVVHIITNSDAGKVFYNRLNEGEILHVDLFHEIKAVDVKLIARDLINALAKDNMEFMADRIDIQTGSGGGRLSGSLNYGKTESLLKDHLNHVHISILLADDKLDFLLFLIENLEESLIRQKVELRRIDRIVNEVGNTPIDMSPYATDSDSYLKQSNYSGNILRSKKYQQALELCEYMGSLRELEEILEFFNSTKRRDLYELEKKYGDLEQIVERLEKDNLVFRNSRSYALTPEGKQMIDFIRANRKELESGLKKIIKKIPENRGGFIKTINSGRKNVRDTKGRAVQIPYTKTDWLEEIEVVETIKKALVRSYFVGEKFSIRREDLVTVKRYPGRGQDICLIIDASASMAGERLRSAKILAKHIVLKSNRRVSVLAFKERNVSLHVPFTKNFSTIDAGVSSITSSGLTPLALALDQGLSYMCSRHMKNPLIMLITDGIPTVPMWSTDPVKDAITAAEKIGKKKIDFCCIGLKPNRDCLTKITQAARGKLFVVDELNRDVLVNVINKSGQLV